jgi:Apea-like HEPN
MTGDPLSGDLYIGLSGLTLEDRVIELPFSAKLEKTYAHLMLPVTLAFKPAPAGGHHPAPWKAARGGFGQDITAQLTVPSAAGETFTSRFEIARVLVFLIRLWSDPAVLMAALSNMPFAEIAEAADATAYIRELEHRPRAFALGLVDDSKTIASLSWVIENAPSALKLTRESSEFRLAAHAMISGQFIEDTALILISLWGALEAIFSPSTSELRFRVSALISSYLNPPGPNRLAHQKQIAELYDKRSAAAHGKSKHDSDDLVQTFELLRKVLIQIIRDGELPTRQHLENKLFGC